MRRIVGVLLLSSVSACFQDGAKPLEAGSGIQISGGKIGVDDTVARTATAASKAELAAYAKTTDLKHYTAGAGIKDDALQAGQIAVDGTVALKADLVPFAKTSELTTYTAGGGIKEDALSAGEIAVDETIARRNDPIDYARITNAPTDKDTLYHAGVGLVLDEANTTFSASIGTGATQLAAGNHTHAEFATFDKKTDKIAWSRIEGIASTTEWPGALAAGSVDPGELASNGASLARVTGGVAALGDAGSGRSRVGLAGGLVVGEVNAASPTTFSGYSTAGQVPLEAQGTLALQAGFYIREQNPASVVSGGQIELGRFNAGNVPLAAGSIISGISFTGSTGANNPPGRGASLIAATQSSWDASVSPSKNTDLYFQTTGPGELAPVTKFAVIADGIRFGKPASVPSNSPITSPMGVARQFQVAVTNGQSAAVSIGDEFVGFLIANYPDGKSYVIYGVRHRRGGIDCKMVSGACTSSLINAGSFGIAAGSTNSEVILTNVKDYNGALYGNPIMVTLVGTN